MRLMNEFCHPICVKRFISECMITTELNFCVFVDFNRRKYYILVVLYIVLYVAISYFMYE